MPDPSDLTTPELAGELMKMAAITTSEANHRRLHAAADRLMDLHRAVSHRGFPVAEAPASPGLRPELRDHLDASWKRNEAAYRHLDSKDHE